MQKIFLISTVFFYCLQITYSQSGQLDPTFGDHGIVKTDMGSPFNYDNAGKQVLIKPDGSIFIIFNTPTFISKRFPDGSIDPAYGLNGYSRSVPFNDASAAFQPDGKIVLAGSISGSGGFIVVRFNVNGMIDSAFGNNGMQITGFDEDSHARAVTVQNDGKIVVAGSTTNPDGDHVHFALARYNTDGSADNMFNGSGKVVTDFGFKIPPDKYQSDSTEFDIAYANTVAIQADGKIVAGGFSFRGTDNDFAIARYYMNGKLDSTFDNDGKLTTGIGSYDDYGNSLAIQSNGKIVLAGYTYVGPDYDFAVARYNNNGSLDNSFNKNGIQTANPGSADQQIMNSVAIQNNGKIVLAGYTSDGTYNDFAVLRFNTDGSPDKTFDNDGRLTTDFISSDDYAGSVSIQRNDKIVVAGYSYIYSSGNTVGHLAVARYNSNGSLDDSFDNDGKLEGNYKQGYTAFNSTSIQNDGKIVAAGITWNGSNYDFAVARFNIDGSPDSTFSNDGKQSADFGPQDDYANSTIIQKDGKIIVAGYSNSQFAIARFNTNGSPDNTFNGNGKRLISLGFGDVCTSAVLQSDGKIIMAGSSYTSANYDSSDFAIARLNLNGTLDNTFNGNGKKLTDVNSSYNFANAAAIQKDGKILLAGRSNVNSISNFSLVRYNTNGDLDTTFSHDGKQDNVFGDIGYRAKSMAIQNDGKILLAGYSVSLSGAGSSFALARYQNNGELDTTFNNNGYQATSLGVHLNFGSSVAVNSDGRIAVGGTNDNFAIILYQKNGNPDSTFGLNGIQTTNIGVGNSTIQSIAFSDDKLYVAGFGEFPGTLGVIAKYLLPQGGVLPVSLLDFKAELQSKSVLLQWKIVTSKNLISFVIERSTDGNRFLPINSVMVSGVLARSYSIVDEQPLQGVNFYRLKMFDAEGKFTYSDIVAVKINTDSKLQIFPNPAKDILFVQVNGENENATVQILDAIGRKVKEIKIVLNGNTSFSIDVHKMSRGNYKLIVYKKLKTEMQAFIKL